MLEILLVVLAFRVTAMQRSGCN